ncbi:MAG TPA: isovaleryl-CoA dehydrogenase [Casimicrobiaceae bacterium]
MMETPFPNQPPPFEGRNLFRIDTALREAVAREAPFAEAAIDAWGGWLGSAEAYALADDANRNAPRLIAHDRRGERVDRVEFHPAWHELMRRAMAEGEHASPWSDPRAGAQVARAAKYYLHAQVENGTQCPLTMTFAAAPVLARHGVGSLPATLLAKVRGSDYDPRELPFASKRSALVGMGMTERQGGSDVRSNTTKAEALADGTWSITGHKWFFSAPQCDAHLVLVRTGAGLGCFLLPRFLPDGGHNAIRISRLKDKLGNRSNASSEVEFDRALGWPVGEPGRGIATILEMVGFTRLDCVIGSAGIMRAALTWAIHHARHRVAFGATLVDQPLMRAVLADLALESEAALALALRLARGVDDATGAATGDATDAAMRAASRVIAPAAKFWVCKRAIAVTAEAMETLGGNGYIEDTPLARFYREAPVNSIWEGSGNVVCLDVVRALAREPEAAEALLGELRALRGINRDYDAHVGRLASLLQRAPDDPAGARRLAQAIALAVSASELVRHAPGFVAGAFCASRLGEASHAGATFGTTSPLVAATDEERIVGRALP